jgi:hypothetical protein
MTAGAGGASLASLSVHGSAATITRVRAGVRAGRVWRDAAAGWLRGLGSRAVATAAEIRVADAAMGNFGGGRNANHLGSAALDKAGNAAFKAAAPAAVPAAAKSANYLGAAALGKAGNAAFKAAPAVAAAAASASGSVVAAGSTATGVISSITSALAAIPVVGWVILAALVVIAGAVYKYWEPIKAFFGGVWKGMKDGWDEWGAPALGALTGALGGILAVLQPVAGAAGDFAGAASAGAAAGQFLAGALTGVIHIATAGALAIQAVVFAIDRLVSGVAFLVGRVVMGLVAVVKSIASVAQAADALRSGNLHGALAHARDAGGAYKDWWAGTKGGASQISNTWGQVLGQRDEKAAPGRGKNPAPAPNLVAASSMVRVADDGRIYTTGKGTEVPRAMALERGLVLQSTPSQSAPSGGPQHSTNGPQAAGPAPRGAPADYRAQAAPGPAAGPTTINYSPTVTINGAPGEGGDRLFLDMLRRHRDELARLVDDALSDRRRWAYGGAK